MQIPQPWKENAWQEKTDIRVVRGHILAQVIPCNDVRLLCRESSPEGEAGLTEPEAMKQAAALASKAAQARKQEIEKARPVIQVNLRRTTDQTLTHGSADHQSACIAQGA